MGGVGATKYYRRSGKEMGMDMKGGVGGGGQIDSLADRGHRRANRGGLDPRQALSQSESVDLSRGCALYQSEGMVSSCGHV